MTRYGAEIVAQTLGEQSANDEDDMHIDEPAMDSPQSAEPIITAVEALAKLKRSRSKKAQTARL